MSTNTSGQQVLQPYVSPLLKDSRRITIEISSRDRDLSKPLQNPAKFRYRFDHPLKDIQSVQLVGGTVPAVYNITTPYNSFLFQQTLASGPTTTTKTITVPPGFYNESTLASTLQTLIRAAFLGNNYTVSVDQTTGYLTIGGVETIVVSRFSLLLQNAQFADRLDSVGNSLVAINGLARFMGFGVGTYTSSDSSSNQTLTSPYAMDILAATSRLYLFINAESKYDIGSIDRGTGRRKPFAIIYPDRLSPAYLKDNTSTSIIPQLYYLNKDTYRPTYVSLPQPMSKISALDIELRDEFGNLVNLAGRDYSLLLDMEVLME